MKRITNIIYDRTFDASCMTRAGETEWAKKILNRIKANYPQYNEQINMLYTGYLSMPMADYIQYRMDYMLEHKDTIKLKYK